MTVEGIKDKNDVLIRRWKICRDKEVREELVCLNEPLVHSIIKRFKDRLDYDDLFQLGMIGLIKAIDRFDLSKNVKFSTYAVPVIIGEIKTFLRDNNSLKISRSIKEQGKKIKKTEEELASYLNRSPTIKEVAEKMGINSEEVAACLEVSKPPLSLDYNYDGENTHDNTVPFEKSLHRNLNEVKNEEIGILELIDGLDQKEKQLIIMRYVEGKKQKEVGKYLGIDQVSVSRWEKKVLKKLRDMNMDVI